VSVVVLAFGLAQCEVAASTRRGQACETLRGDAAGGCVGEGVVEEVERPPAVAGAQLERLAGSRVVDDDPEIVVLDPDEQDVDTIGGAVGEFGRHLALRCR
jgi:hypothetical protein